MKGKSLRRVISVILIAVLTVSVVSVAVIFLHKVHVEKQAIDQKYEEAFEVVKSLNQMAGDYTDFETGNGTDQGLIIERQDQGYRIYLGSELEKCLDAICENFNISTGEEPTVTPAQVITAITDHAEETVRDCKTDSNSKESNVVFKLSKWMGSNCGETVVYCGGDAYDKTEKEKWLLLQLVTNGNVIYTHSACDKSGEPYEFKFKWQ